ncbi:hypothetical protein ACRDNQ_10160 [Palleronia sp. KMU-117]|uniref:hypothetical protein n=1 Tax=Palleronia sp. KMU-117 TaxID=3434108 RepID=UPI003D7528A9
MTSSADAHLVGWSQTRIDARRPGPVADLRPGAIWEWRGRAIPLTAGTGAFADHTLLLAAIRKVLPAARFREGLDAEAPVLDRCVTLVHAAAVFEAVLVELAELARPLILFRDGLPPQGEPLRVAGAADAPGLAHVASDPARSAPLTATRIRV